MLFFLQSTRLNRNEKNLRYLLFDLEMRFPKMAID